MLTNFTSAYNPDLESFYSYGTRQTDLSRILPLQNAPFTVSLKIDGVLIGKYTKISGDTPFTITLNTPYPLYSGKTYTLQVQMCLDVVDRLQLKARRCDHSGPFTCLRNDIIRAQTQQIKGNAELIQQLCFNCKSNRE